MCGNLLCAGLASLGGWGGEVGGLAQVFIVLILLRLSGRQTHPIWLCALQHGIWGLYCVLRQLRPSNQRSIEDVYFN